MDVSYRLESYDYDLPEHLIAQYPAQERDGARLMLLNRGGGPREHGVFRNLPDYLRSGDLLVVNDSRVIPARLFGIKDTTGKVEVLLVRERDRGSAEEMRSWECMVRPARRVRKGTRIEFSEEFHAVVRERLIRGRFVLDFSCVGKFEDEVERVGHSPLPPYIRRPDASTDRERYQTVYARECGSLAAPTAGLHFTPGLMDRIGRMGATVASITLHVGLGTFLPVETPDVRDHKIHSEQVTISAETASLVNRTRKEGGRVVAVGTTSLRSLEYAAGEDGLVRPGRYSCDLYIYPGYRFKTADSLITNFHLPRSSLILLCSAFAGRENLLEAYREAVDRGYRFYSYGDAMMIG